jgi:tetrathionate reductase subunit B
MSSESEKPDLQRREFIGKAAAVGAAATVVPGVVLVSVANANKPADQAVSDKNRWGMLVDTEKCVDCGDCVKACNEENGLTAASHENHELTDSQWIRMVKLSNNSTGKVTSLPMMCQHCESPPCVDVCPTGASFKREDGIVLVDRHICIGCRYCMMSCPYKARSFVHEVLTDQVPHMPRGKGTVEACTLCMHKVDNNEGTTACVEACTSAGHDALLFGDLNDKNSTISTTLKKVSSRAIREDLNLNPGVRYTGI